MYLKYEGSDTKTIYLLCEIVNISKQNRYSILHDQSYTILQSARREFTDLQYLNEIQGEEIRKKK